MLTDRQFPDPLPPTANPFSDLTHPMPPARTDSDRPHVYALTMIDTARRYIKLLVRAEADEFLAILGDMLVRLNPAPAPARVQAVAAIDDGGDVFPGIFAGSAAGDFGGLPPAPEQIAARVPDLAGRLREVARLYNSFLVAIHVGMNTEDYCRLAAGGTKLMSVIDEIASEAGDQ